MATFSISVGHKVAETDCLREEGEYKQKLLVVQKLTAIKNLKTNFFFAQFCRALDNGQVKAIFCENAVSVQHVITCA